MTHTGTGDIVLGDKHEHYHKAPHIVPKILTQQTGLANDIDFVGREEELKKVDVLLTQNSMLLLLNGIGGIGKSTLASYYLNQQKENYDYYGFIQVNNDIKLSLTSALSTSLDLKSEKIDDLFAEALNKLQNLEGQKLLIIDDVKEMDNQLDEMNTLMTLKNSGFKILFTSREVKEYIPKYFLDIMSLEDARTLFLKHHATDEMEKVDKILEYLDYHTLFIEITAKTLTKRKNTLSLDKVIEKFENGEFTSVKRNKSESFNKFLKNFSYDSTMLTQKKNLLFLKRLSVLPSIEISFQNLYKFLVCEDEELLEDFLIELIENGWLISSDGGYKFHQILKEFVLDNYTPIFEEFKSIFNFFITLMGDTDNSGTALINQENIVYYNSIYLVVDKTNVQNLIIITFFEKLGNLYYHLDSYKKALPIYKESLKFYKNNSGKTNPKTLKSINNLARLYWAMGDYTKSLPLLKNVLNYRKSTLGFNHEDTAVSYNNLGLLYWTIGKYKKSYPFLNKSLIIRKKVLGYNHFQTATSYNNLGLLYWTMEEYRKSQYSYVHALKIRIKVLGKKHPDTAKIYHNLALLYRSTEKYQKSLIFFNKALKIKEEVLGKDLPSTAASYNAIAELYKLLKDNKNALSFFNKALEIRKKFLGEEHPYTAMTYHDLAVFYLEIQNFKKAYEYITLCLNIRNKALPPNHPHLLSSKKRFDEIKQKMS